MTLDPTPKPEVDRDMIAKLYPHADVDEMIAQERWPDWLL